MTLNSAKVLAVPADALVDFYGCTGFLSDPQRVRHALDIVQECGQFYVRKWAEQTEAVRQMIPCAVVYNGARVLCVKRAKEGRSDLRLRYTLLFGGHVDTVDSQGDREHILHRCAERELHEELGLRATVSPDPIGVVVDVETASSRRHFGVVFECRISEDYVRVQKACDSSEFTRSSVNDDHLLVETKKLVGRKFDPWSQLLLNSAFAHRKFATSQSDFAVQLPLGLLTE